MPSTEPHPDGERLQKVLATAGVASRRGAEELIADGRVEVNGEIVTEFGRRVDPRRAVIHVDGKRIVLDPGLRYYVVNKPRGVLTTMDDDRGRKTVANLLTTAQKAGVIPRGARLFHVGRLDADSEGLLLLTNDGDLTHRLTHPSYGIEKVYLAEIPGPLRPATRKRLLEGVELDGRPVEVHAMSVIQKVGSRVLVELVVHEGRKHVIRRLLEEVGHPVSRLVRTRIGPVRLGQLPPGQVRALTMDEVGELHAAVGL
jgi:pseudouridine synthase